MWRYGLILFLLNGISVDYYGLIRIDMDCIIYIYAFILINMTMGSESTGNQSMERWVNVNESGLIWIHMGHMGYNYYLQLDVCSLNGYYG